MNKIPATGKKTLKKKNQAIAQAGDTKSEKRQAISKVFSCPNLPLYIYFKNWNYLVNSEMDSSYTPHYRDLYCWKQNIQKLGTFNMTSEETKFNLQKERLEENPNKKALWGQDLQKLFETKEEDIKNLIDSSIKPSLDFLSTQKKNNALIDAHNNLIFENKQASQNVVLSKGSPLFYNSDGDMDDGLVNFHNKLNRNLFCRKNFKLLKTFYDNKNIKGPIDDLETKKDNTEEEKTLNELDDNQIEYLLEQRAFAMKNLNKRQDVIKDKFPLKERVKPDFRKTATARFMTAANKTGSNFRTTRTRMNQTARNNFMEMDQETSHGPQMEKSITLDPISTTNKNNNPFMENHKLNLDFGKFFL